MTFAGACNAYLDAGGDGRFLRAPLELLGTRPVASLTQADMDEVAKATYADAAPSTINRQVYTPVAAVLRFAADQGWRGPVGRVRRRKEAPAKKPWLRIWQASRVLRFSGRYMPMITLAIESGLRSSELLALTWDDVELEAGRLHIWQNKANTYRIARFGSRSAASLGRLDRTTPAVFVTASGAPYARRENSGATLQTPFRKISERSGVRVTPHMLRHTWATWAYAVSKDMMAVRDGGGWASTALVEHYAKVAPPDYGKRVIGAGWELFGRQAQ